MKDLKKFISNADRVIFLDGATGTMLEAAGMEMSGLTNLIHPDVVHAIHREYAGCGIDILTTNTLLMNRVKVESHNMNINVKEANIAAVGLARSAAAEDQYVVGDIGPTGKMLKPYGVLSEDEAYRAFREQASVLAEAGVDGFIVETMFSLREALCALRACRESANLPVFMSMSFDTVRRGGRTIMGDSAGDCAKILAEEGAAVVGVNCGSLDPERVAKVVSVIRERTSLPIIAQPNAGKPRFVEHRTVFDMSPSDFAAGIYRCFQAGAGLLGGCCGTTPDHIRAMVIQFREQTRPELYDR